MEFETTCPKCGAEDELYVVEFTAYCRIRLANDGFDIFEAKEFRTEDEYVRCDECGEVFPLSLIVTEVT